MKKVPLGPNRVKLSNHHDQKHDYGQIGKEEDKAYDFTKQVEKGNNNEKEEEKANNNEEKIYMNKIEKEKTDKKIKNENKNQHKKNHY